MTRTLFALALLAGAGTLAVPPQAQQPPASQTDQTVRISVDGGRLPKLAIAPFIALSQDAETVAAARTIGDVLFDDIDYEREFYLLKKDTLASVAKPSSLDDLALDKWKELGADGLLVGSVRKDGNG